MIVLRRADPADLEILAPRTLALNRHEGIAIAEPRLRDALAELLARPELGGVWLVEGVAAQDRSATDEVVGYALVTYGFDLEFGGRDAFLTELWIDEDARGRGLGSAALERLCPLLAECGVHALHLQVRPDNPAQRLYSRAGFSLSPRRVMTRTLIP
ncbi:MAG: GNAT family N-acetyltransferase [Myxococcota bacterium]